ncbi:Zn-dependent alcohol dehydrogenase [Microbacterium sp. No. 7]|uniref:Zn-dependent alcohol dehydrogenase n=1 Tax=Microbacterium sp. No. 7 TaxID=1714373 RepID=UPI0006D0F691|nr:Zn-dependent alcohol dehydrogenase [Microbacterium sp. No. 7]ALJ19302.1 alcohol dehydrogenase [Microbacterium sp. No. 7]
MKAAVMRAVGAPLDIIDDLELGEVGPREVRVKVKAAGLCHSDLTVLNNDYGWPYPAVLGHELAGIVEEIGSQVTAVKVGDHVVGNLVTSCGVCVDCRRGRYSTCTDPGSVRRPAGSPARLFENGEPIAQLADLGAFLEETILHERNLVVVDKAVPFDRAALLGCGVLTGIGAVKNVARVQLGETVAVLGCGGVGLNVIQGAALVGARRIIAIDLQPGKLELAKRFGATDTINPAEVDDLAARVREITGERGVDHSFEVIGLPVTAQQAIDITTVGGTMYQVGMHKPGTVVGLGQFDLLRGQKAIQGLHMGKPIPEYDIPLYADLYRQGRLNLDDLVSQTIPLERINEAYADLERGEIARSVVVFD